MTFREERKKQTRQELLHAALALTAEGIGFSVLSLREVTRKAGLVPTAFYRHFTGMDELGLALVDEVCLELRRLMREVRLGSTERELGEPALRASIASYVAYVSGHRAAFGFLTRERSGGSTAMRRAIARELRYFTQELAADLRYLPPLREAARERLEMVADLVVNTVANMTLELLDLGEGERAREELEERVHQQLRLIFAGALALPPPPPPR